MITGLTHVFAELLIGLVSLWFLYADNDPINTCRYKCGKCQTIEQMVESHQSTVNESNYENMKYDQNNNAGKKYQNSFFNFRREYAMSCDPLLRRNAVEISKNAGRLWRQMTEDEKFPYRVMAAKARCQNNQSIKFRRRTRRQLANTSGGSQNRSNSFDLKKSSRDFQNELQQNENLNKIDYHIVYIQNLIIHHYVCWDW